MSDTNSPEYVITDANGIQRDTVELYGKRFKLVNLGVGAITSLLIAALVAYIAFRYFHGLTNGGFSEETEFSEILGAGFAACAAFFIVFYVTCARKITKEELKTLRKKSSK